MTNTDERIRNLLSRPTPAQWRELTLGDVVAARVWHKRRLYEVTVGFLTVWVVIALLAGWYALSQNPALFITIAIASVAYGVVAVTIIERHLRLARHLQPLENLQRLEEDPLTYRTALALLKNPNVQDYRDAVVAKGRELLLGDFECMNLILKNLDIERTRRILRGQKQPAA